MKENFLKRKLWIIFILINQTIIFNIQAQENEIPIAEDWKDVGNPLIQTYESKFFKHSTPIRSGTKNNNGLLFFNDAFRITMFDGSGIKTLPFIMRTQIHSLHYVDDTLWIGGEKEIAFWVTDENGHYKKENYHSLTHLLPDSLQSDIAIWNIKTAKGFHYFLSRNGHLIIFKKGKFVIIPVKNPSNYLFEVNETIYVNHNYQLNKIVNDKLTPINNLRKRNVTYIEKYDQNNLLISSNKKLYLFNGNTLIPFAENLNKLFEDATIFSGLKISENLFAIPSYKGIFIINKKGELCKWLNNKTGLLNDRTLALIYEKEGVFWAGNYLGIHRITINSPISEFNKANGLNVTTFDLINYQGKLLAGTMAGILSLKEMDSENLIPVFEKFGNTNNSITDLKETSYGILVGTTNGLYQLKGEDLVRIEIPHISGIRNIHQLKTDSTLIMFYTGNSLHLIERNKNSWVYLGKIHEFPSENKDFIEDKNGCFWFRDRTNLYSLRINKDLLKKNKIKDALLKGKFYIKSYSIPFSCAFVVDGITRISQKTGLYYHDYENDTLILDNTFGGGNFVNRQHQRSFISEAVQGPNGDVWFHAYKVISGNQKYNISEVGKHCYFHAVKKQDGTFHWDNTPFQQIQHYYAITSIHLDPKGKVWYTTWGNELIRFDPSIKRDYHTPYPNYVKTITEIESERTLFNGHAKTNPENFLLSYDDNSISIEYGAQVFEKNDSVYYRTKLEGYDDWSPWTHSKVKSYAGLKPGVYNFKVESLNIYKQPGIQANFRFEIITPWFLSYWAYALYTVLAIGFIYAIVKFRVNRLEKDRKKLTLQVKERTLQLEKQAKKLREMDKYKTRFYTNITHEFRTPLTVMLGLNEQIEKENDALQPITKIIKRNGLNLLQLINQILNLSKLESGMLSPEMKQGDIIEYLKYIVESFHSWADKKEIKVHFRSELKSKVMDFDSEKILNIVSNLISNAIKFTENNGYISIVVGQIFDNYNPYLEIRVTDSGVGIPVDKLSHIFDRFYQVDGSSTRKNEGTGIGLSLTKELITLLKGTIEVKSNVGQGSEFIVHLPITNSSPQVTENNNNPELIDHQIETHEIIPEEETDAGKPIALVVEDNQDVIFYLQNCLKEKYNIKTAINGNQGIDLARTLLPDIVISDVMMPEKNGYELCDALKNDVNTSHIPIILLTAKASVPDKIEGLKSGADAYLTKPFNKAELDLRIENLLMSRKKLWNKFKENNTFENDDLEVTSQDEVFLKKILEVLEQNKSNPQFTTESLYKNLGVSRTLLYVKLKALTGQSPSEFIRQYRLKYAAILIEKDYGNYAQIAYEAGFNDQSYFTKSFKKYFGMAPSEYAKTKMP